MFEAALELLFPSFCLGCGRQMAGYRLPLLCARCLSDIFPIGPPYCSRCGLPFPSGESHLCGDCLQNHFSFDLARAAVVYRQPVSSLLLSLKFGGRLAGLDSMARIACLAGVRSFFSEPDLIIPVPLHIYRLRERGFNQALLLARACFPDWRDRICLDLLKRVVDTRPQSSLSGVVRRKNLKGAFEVDCTGPLDDRSVLLVDDVFTTGSTVNECTKVLRKAGAERIEVFTLARTI